MNLTLLFGKSDILNLGLLPIRNSLTSKKIMEMVEDKLKAYNLSLDKDVVCVITDGTSVMTCLGKLIPNLQQLCIAHGIQLAVTDVLYTSFQKQQTATMNTEYQAESDSEDEIFSTTDFSVELEEPNVAVDISHTHYLVLIKKVRKIVKLYKRSPLKNEKLQHYVKIDFGKEQSMLLDSKTRWNSLLTMLERFCKLKNCIMKTQIDIESDLALTMENLEFDRLQELVDALSPIKCAVEAVCRRDANLLTADASLNFALDKLYTASTPISLELLEALRRRILERRTDQSSVLQYLHTGSLTDDSVDIVFQNMAKTKISKFILNLTLRLNPHHQELEENVEIEEREVPIEKRKKTDLQQELALALEKVGERAHKAKLQDTNLQSTITKEMNLFEAGGTRGFHLELVYQYLMTISPTSVESERVFSSAGYLCNKVRSSLSDETLSELSFLRSYFQVNDC